MRWFWTARRPSAERRSFAALQALPPDQRRAAFAGEHGEAWLSAAAEYGLVEAQVLLGQRCLDRGEPAQALRWFQAGAGAGFPAAQNMLGRCLEHGWGTQRDLPGAAEQYRLAAEAGLDWGQFNRANVLLYGLGVARDPEQAFTLFSRAAALGHVKSMNMLARFHEEGWCGPPDPAQALLWYRRGAEAGDFRAQYNLGTILAGAGRRAEALAWFARSLATGSPDFVAAAGAALRSSGDAEYRAVALREGGAPLANRE